MKAPPHPQARAAVLACSLALLAALCIFTWRTSLLHGPPLSDFYSFYAAADAMVRGANPYDHPTLMARWRDIAPTLGSIEHVTAIASPTTLLLVAPLVALAPAGAAAVWLAATLLMLAAIIWMVADLSHLTLPAGLILATFTLLLGPVQVGIQMGQCSTASIFCIVLGLWLGTRQRHRAAGMLLGLAAAWKPQLGGLAIIYFALTADRRTTIAALATGAAITAAALLWLTLGAEPWLETWRDNIATTMQGSALNSLSPSNPTRDHMINLQVFLMGLTGRPDLATSGAWLVTLLLLAIVLFNRQLRDAPPLLGLSLLLAIGCLPVYHRYYDAAFVVLVLGWLLAQPNRSFWPLKIAVLLFLAPVGLPTTLLAEASSPVRSRARGSGTPSRQASPACSSCCSA